MHDDLLQLDLLKRDKKAASFVTISEPDIRLHLGAPNSDSARPEAKQKRADSEIGAPQTAIVEIAGLDIYDPIENRQKIAVRVISQFGEEKTKVLEVR